MIPILYEPLETSFDHNGIGHLSETKKATVTEERNGCFELVIQYPVDGKWYAHINEGSIIKCKSNEVSSPQLFRVYKSGKPLNGMVTYYAAHISYDMSGIPLIDFSAENVNAHAAISIAFSKAAISSQFTAESDITALKSISIDAPCSMRALLCGPSNSILSIWGGEYEFDNFNIILHEHRGNDNGVTIDYGKNLTDIKQETDISDCYTHIMPYAVKNDESGKQYVYLTEKVIALPNSQLIGQSKVHIMDFSEEFSDDESITESALREKALAYSMNAVISPMVNITASFVQLWQTEEYKNIAPLERVQLCDTVTVRFGKLGISKSLKVIKTVFDALGEKYESVTLGDAKETLSDAIINQTTAIEKAVSEVEKYRSEFTVDREKLLSRIELIDTGFSSLEQTFEGFETRVENVEGSISTVSQTVSSFSVRIQNAENKVSEFTQTINSIKLSVSSTNSNNQTSSQIKLTATGINESVTINGTTAAQAKSIADTEISGISLSVTNGDESSSFTLKSGNAVLSSGTIKINGMVTFSSLSTSGKTTINGDNITTGTLDCSKITVKNLSADSITSGTISADRIDVDSLKIKQLYTYVNGKYKAAVSGTTSSTTKLYIGGEEGNQGWNFSEVYMMAGNTFHIKQYNSYSTSELLIDPGNRVVRPNNNGYWSIGTSTYPFGEVRTKDLYVNGDQIVAKDTELQGLSLKSGGTSTHYIIIGGDSAPEIYPYGSGNSYLGTPLRPFTHAYIGSLVAQIGTGSNCTLGFFGATPTGRRSIATATSNTQVTVLNNLITALKDYGLIN